MMFVLVRQPPSSRNRSSQKARSRGSSLRNGGAAGLGRSPAPDRMLEVIRLGEPVDDQVRLEVRQHVVAQHPPPSRSLASGRKDPGRHLSSVRRGKRRRNSPSFCRIRERPTRHASRSPQIGMPPPATADALQARRSGLTSSALLPVQLPELNDRQVVIPSFGR